jgi:predicted MPP superfamily phosphohydrolase
MLKKPWNFFLVALIAVSLFLPFPLIVLRRYGIENSVVDAAIWTAYTGSGFISFVLTFQILKDLFHVSALLIKKLVVSFGFRQGSNQKPETAIDMNRRSFLINSMSAGIIGFSGGFTAYGMNEVMDTPEVREVLVPIKNLPKSLDGFRIAQITDFHIGYPGKREWVESVVNKVNALAPDIVAYTGDLADGSVERLGKEIEPLSGLTATYGNFFVTGNHEYYWGINEWIECAKRLGFTVLLNENRTIYHNRGRILLGGVADYRAGYFIEDHASSPEKSLEGASDADVKILLAHQPKSIFKSSKAGYDLQISGHTHGGQFFPWNYLVCLDQPFTEGLHKFNNTLIYVSRGTGFWGPPVRLCAPSEITLLKLKCEVS